MSPTRTRGRAAAALVILAVAALGAGPASAAVTPYGTDDAGGFRDVLPPGTNGLNTLTDFAAFTALSARPPHSFDQLPLYRDLLYASPTLTDAQVPSYFKDATFGVRMGRSPRRRRPLPV